MRKTTKNENIITKTFEFTNILDDKVIISKLNALLKETNFKIEVMCKDNIWIQYINKKNTFYIDIWIFYKSCSIDVWTALFNKEYRRDMKKWQ